MGPRRTPWDPAGTHGTHEDPMGTRSTPWDQEDPMGHRGAMGPMGPMGPRGAHGAQEDPMGPKRTPWDHILARLQMGENDALGVVLVLFGSHLGDIWELFFILSYVGSSPIV